MRLLTALEDLLGSLGPQITAILSRALKLEKKREGTCGLILEDENCAAILELTKEKLAGQIVAGKFLLFFITKETFLSDVTSHYTQDIFGLPD